MPDWKCNGCGEINLNKDLKCKFCNKYLKPLRGLRRSGDWYCQVCHFDNFGKNVWCRNCKKVKK